MLFVGDVARDQHSADKRLSTCGQVSHAGGISPTERRQNNQQFMKEKENNLEITKP